MKYTKGSNFKGSPDPSHFIFEINIGKGRIRHRTTLKLNFQIDSKSIENGVIQIQSHFMSGPTFSDIDFENKMALVWTTLKVLTETDFRLEP